MGRTQYNIKRPQYAPTTCNTSVLKKLNVGTCRDKIRVALLSPKHAKGLNECCFLLSGLFGCGRAVDILITPAD